MRQRGRNVGGGRLHWRELWVVFQDQILGSIMKTFLHSLKPMEKLEEAKDDEEGDKEAGGEEQLAQPHLRLHHWSSDCPLFQILLGWVPLETRSVDGEVGDGGEQLVHARFRPHHWKPFHCPSSDRWFSKKYVLVMFLHFSFGGNVTYFQLSKCQHCKRVQKAGSMWFRLELAAFTNYDCTGQPCGDKCVMWCSAVQFDEVQFGVTGVWPAGPLLLTIWPLRSPDHFAYLTAWPLWPTDQYEHLIISWPPGQCKQSHCNEKYIQFIRVNLFAFLFEMCNAHLAKWDAQLR